MKAVAVFCRSVGYFLLLWVALLGAPPGVEAGVSYPASMLEIMSVRAAGLGGAYVSLANTQDPLSAVINPASPSASAGPAWGRAKAYFADLTVALGGHTRTGAYNEIFGQQGYLGIGFRFGPHVPLVGIGRSVPLGVSLYGTSYHLDDLIAYDRQGNYKGRFGASDSMFGLALSTDIANLVNSRIGPLYAGFNLNLQQQVLGATSSEHNLAFSYGLLFKPDLGPRLWQFSLGLAHIYPRFNFLPFNKLNTPYRLKNGTARTNEDLLPSEIHAGMCFRIHEPGREISTICDFIVREPRVILLKPAMESRWGGISARAGYQFRLQNNDPSLYVEESSLNRLSLGAGYSMRRAGMDLRLDYAFQVSHGDRSLGNQQRVSFTLIY